MAANSGKSVKNVQFNEEAISNKQVAAGELEAYSVYVANVDYGCTAEELKTHFERCGRVNRPYYS
jgi:RNA recognition motif-containing protein